MFTFVNIYAAELAEVERDPDLVNLVCLCRRLTLLFGGVALPFGCERILFAVL